MKERKYDNSGLSETKYMRQGRKKLRQRYEIIGLVELQRKEMG
jgi:hypothetical protein